MPTEKEKVISSFHEAPELLWSSSAIARAANVAAGQRILDILDVLEAEGVVERVEFGTGPNCHRWRLLDE